MNTGTAHTQSNLSVFLLGAILNILAVVDYASLFDYSIKAVAGGIIWLAFSVLSEHLKQRIRNRHTRSVKPKQPSDGK